MEFSVAWGSHPLHSYRHVQPAQEEKEKSIQLTELGHIMKGKTEIAKVNSVEVMEAMAVRLELDCVKREMETCKN